MTPTRGRTLAACAGSALLGVVLICGVTAAAEAPPAVVPRLELSLLVGDWYEIATTGTWWHRRCLSDTRYHFAEAGRPQGLRASSICTSATGVEVHRGRLRAHKSGDGRLSIRFTPLVFSWLPATWSDFWVLEVGDGDGWLLVGDNKRERLSIVSRTVSLDDASVARALAAARRLGYSVGRLATVPHPAGATGLLPRR